MAPILMSFLQPQQLLIQLEDWEGNTTSIAVNNFIIGTEFFKSEKGSGRDDSYFPEFLGLE